MSMRFTGLTSRTPHCARAALWMGADEGSDLPAAQQSGLTVQLDTTSGRWRAGRHSANGPFTLLNLPGAKALLQGVSMTRRETDLSFRQACVRSREDPRSLARRGEGEGEGATDEQDLLRKVPDPVPPPERRIVSVK